MGFCCTPGNYFVKSRRRSRCSSTLFDASAPRLVYLIRVPGGGGSNMLSV